MEERNSGHLIIAFERVLMSSGRYVKRVYWDEAWTRGGEGAGYNAEGLTGNAGMGASSGRYSSGIWVLRVGSSVCIAVRSSVVEYLQNA